MVAMLQSKHWPGLFPKNLSKGPLPVTNYLLRHLFIGAADDLANADANPLHGKLVYEAGVSTEAHVCRCDTLLSGEPDDAKP